MPSLPSAVAALFAITEMQGRLRLALDTDERLAAFANSEKLLLVHLDEPKRMGEIAQSLHCMPSNVTALVDQLEARGLLQRETCPDDRRAKRLVLTPRGKVARKTVIDAMAEVFSKHTGFRDRECEALLSLFAGGEPSR